MEDRVLETELTAGTMLRPATFTAPIWLCRCSGPGLSSVRGVGRGSVKVKGCRQGQARLHGFAESLLLSNLNVNSHMHLMDMVSEDTVLESPLE